MKNDEAIWNDTRSEFSETDTSLVAYGPKLSEYEVENLEGYAESCGTSDIFTEEFPEEATLEEHNDSDEGCVCCGEHDFDDDDFSAETYPEGSNEIISRVHKLIRENNPEQSIIESLLQTFSGSFADTRSHQEAPQENANVLETILKANDTIIGPQMGGRFEVISRPGNRLHLPLKEGDVIIKKIPGYRKPYEGVLIEKKLIQSSELLAETRDSRPLETGFYGKVIENFPYKRDLDNPNYRRILDSLNSTANDTYILRLPQEVNQVKEVQETGGTFRKIRPNEVQYLALEGGGGKGFAFIGAIQKLEQMGIIRFRNGKLDSNRLKGISGASAGAISAVFLALGHNASSITSIMNSINFNSFFDLPRYRRKIPGIGGCRTGSEGRFLQVVVTTIRAMVSSFPLIGSRAAGYVAQKFREYISSPRRTVNVNSGPLQKLLAYWPLYLRNLIEDFGIFSGCAARDFFDRKIGEKFNGRRNVTFRQLYEHTGVNLVLTTVNVESGNSEYLSHETTPNLPVADAIRMSMSLPYIYKPYRITTTEASRMGARRLAGLYIDGGTRNNIPIRAFQRFVRGGIPNTLGLRLELDKRGRIDNVLKFFLHYSLMPGLLGTGESNVSVTSGYSEQIISLDTTGLSTLDFNPSRSIRTTIINRSRRTVAQYFSP